MDALQRLLLLPGGEKAARGLLHTPREIWQQPETWASTHKLLCERGDDVRAFLSRCGIGVATEPRPTVLLVGAGTSDYIGRCVAPLLRRAWGCGAFAVPSTELLTAMSDYVAGRARLWISFSRSGDSSEGVAVLEEALERHPDVCHLVVTCNAGGRMAREFRGRPNVLCIVLDDE